MRLEPTRDAAAFAELAAACLTEQPERSILAGTLHGSRAGAYGPDAPLRAAIHDDAGGSNRIYAAIGYVRCPDWEQHRLHPARPNPR